MSSPFSAVKGLVVGRWLLAVVTVVVCVLGGLVLVGGSVATTGGGGPDEVTGIVTQRGSVRVHNFEVADLHTYTITSSGHYSHNCPTDYGDAAKTGANAVADVGDVLKGLPKGRNSGVRTVGSDQELGDLYGTLSRGGTPVQVPGYKGSWVELPNGTRVGIRDASKSGGRTIDIKMPDGTTQKVHIDG